MKRNPSTSAFSLVEILVVLGIILILAALLFPVFSKAKENAKITTCQQALKQSATAVALYRTEHNGDGVLGGMAQMGLPPAPFIRSLPTLVPLSHQCQGKSLHPMLNEASYRYRYVPVPEDEKVGFGTWKEYVMKHSDSAVIIMDLNHNSSFQAVEDSSVLKVAIGVSLDTSVTRRNRSGQPFDMPTFWH